MNGRVAEKIPGKEVVVAIRVNSATIRRYCYRYATKRCGPTEWLFLKYAGRAK